MRLLHEGDGLYTIYLRRSGYLAIAYKDIVSAADGEAELPALP